MSAIFRLIELDSLMPSCPPASPSSAIVNTARDLNYFPKLDKGDPARANGVSPPRICTGEKAKRMLGISYRKMPETLRDVLDDYRARGWLAKYE